MEHIDNNRKDILILGDVPTKGLDGITFTAKAIYFINFVQSKRKFCLSFHYNGSNSFYLLMLQKYINSKQKILE